MKFGDNHTEYAVESGIPIPSPPPRRTGKIPLRVRSTLRYPLHCMRIGDSFFAPMLDANPKKFYAAINRITQNWISRYPNYRFALRKLTERGKVGVRVWRVAPRIGIGSA